MGNRAMKDSRVEWIGDIPYSWEVKPLKYVANIQTGNTPSMKNKHYYSDNGIDWVKTNNLLGTKGVKESEVKLSIEGSKVARIAKAYSTLVSCIGDVGKMGYIKFDSAYNQQINAVSFYEGEVYWKYGMYYISVQKEQHQYYQNGNVLKILNTENQKRIVVPVPNLEEQKRIVAFLDEKVSHIDNIIGDTKKSIENLKGYKQSLITETVTKGLDPNVEMKDSGIEWIRKIPKHWKVSKLKYIKDNEKYAIVDGPFGSDMKVNDYVNTGIPITQLNNISPMKHELKNLKFVSEEKAESLKRHQVFPNDLLVAKMMPAGRTCIVSNEYEKYMLSSDSIRVKVNREIANSIYVAYHLNALNIHEAEMYSKGTTRIRINLGIVNNYFVLLPPLEEQNLIAEYLNDSVKDLDKILYDKEQLITDLESYKNSIIYEYVTGKKEVM